MNGWPLFVRKWRSPEIWLGNMSQPRLLPLCIYETQGRVNENFGNRKKAFSLCCRLVAVTRGEDGSFGFVLSGQDPVWVKSVMPGSAAQRAGLSTGDAILQLNAVDVRSQYSSLFVCFCVRKFTENGHILSEWVAFPSVFNEPQLTPNGGGFIPKIYSY